MLPTRPMVKAFVVAFSVAALATELGPTPTPTPTAVKIAVRRTVIPTAVSHPKNAEPSFIPPNSSFSRSITRSESVRLSRSGASLPRVAGPIPSTAAALIASGGVLCSDTFAPMVSCGGGSNLRAVSGPRAVGNASPIGVGCDYQAGCSAGVRRDIRVSPARA